MKSPVAKAPAAVADLLEQFAFLANESPAVARRFFDAVEQTLDILSSDPLLDAVYDSANPRLADLRVWRVRGFEKHLLFYRAYSNTVVLIRVLHGSQDIASILDEL